MLGTEQARGWLDRWDRQQEFYIADREERFHVIADVVAAAACGRDPLVVDLGAGPGSLSVRLLDRMPAARVVAVDADPLLLGLARAAYGERAGLRIVARDLREPGWADDLHLDHAPDAVVSTTALHWLAAAELRALYRGCAKLLAPGGVLVNGDHLAYGPQQEQLGRIARDVREGRAHRVGIADREDWVSWWDAAGRAPELAGLLGERGARPIEHGVENTPTFDDHVRLLRDAGFAEVGTVWQHGDDRVLVAVR